MLVILKMDIPEGEMKRFYKNGAVKARLFFSNKGENATAKLYNTYGQLAAKVIM